MVTRRFNPSSPHAEIGVGTNHTIGECRAAGPGRSRAPMTMRLSASHLIMFPMIETQGLIVELSTGCHCGRHSPRAQLAILTHYGICGTAGRGLETRRKRQRVSSNLRVRVIGSYSSSSDSAAHYPCRLVSHYFTVFLSLLDVRTYAWYRDNNLNRAGWYVICRQGGGDSELAKKISWLWCMPRQGHMEAKYQWQLARRPSFRKRSRRS